MRQGGGIARNGFAASPLCLALFQKYEAELRNRHQQCQNQQHHQNERDRPLEYLAQ
jgi:hypothetical protein